MRTISYVEAVCEAFHEELARDPKVFVMGEDVKVGGAFGTLRGLADEFGEARVRNTPISEEVFAGAAIGAALSGWRPVVELMFGTFSYLAMDQLCNQAAKLRYMTGGQARLPIVYRMINGAIASAAAQHSACVHSQFLNVPGLKIVIPSSPADVKGLLKTAIRDPNPVLMFDSGRLLGVKGEVPTDEYLIPFGECAVRREGTDVTIVAIGYMVGEALASAEVLERDGVSVEVIDPRSLVPLDIEGIVESVRKTHRLIVVDESTPCGSAASEIVSVTVEAAFEYLDAPPTKVCSANTPMPFSPGPRACRSPEPRRDRQGGTERARRRLAASKREIMRVDVVMPKWGLTMQEATIVRWLKNVGASVLAEEPLLEIETEKVDAEILSPSAGTLVQIFFEAGAVVPVGKRLAIVETDGGSNEEGVLMAVSEPGDESRQQSVPTDVSDAGSETSVQETSVQLPLASSFVRATPLARRVAKELKVDLGSISGTGHNGQVTERDVVAAAGRPPVADKAGVSTTLLRGMRRTIARTMLKSVQESAQVTLTTQADVTALTVVANEARASFSDILVFVTTVSLTRHAVMNFTPCGR